MIKPNKFKDETEETAKNRLEMRNSTSRFIFANIFM